MSETVSRTLTTLSIMFLCMVVGIKVLLFPFGDLGHKLNSQLDETYKVTTDARLAVDNANSVALDARFYYEHQLPVVALDIHTLLTTANLTVSSLGSSSLELNKVLNNVDYTLQGFKPIEDNVAKIVSSPEIPQIIANTDEATKSAKDTVANIDATSNDVHTAVHDYTTQHGWLYKLFTKIF